MTIEEIKEMLNPATSLDQSVIKLRSGRRELRATLCGVELNTQSKKAELVYELPEVKRAPRATTASDTPRATRANDAARSGAKK